MSLRAHAAVSLAALTLAACGSAPPKNAPSPKQPVPVPAPAPPVSRTPPPPTPAELDGIPDAVPKAEPRSLRGNPPWYEVFGKRYYIMSTAEGFRERGVASWYGPDFHAKLTSSGEPYDMYAMTAAHKTLPIPCYARVTNLSNGRSVIVRINDRGPFVANRIIDLSYTAALKLDMTRAGTTFVEMEVLSPGSLPDTARALTPPTVPTLAGPVLFLQAGAFGLPANAEQLATRLRSEGIEGVNVLPPDTASPLYRVRIGPIADVGSFDRVAARLTGLGIDSRLVTP